MPLKYTEIFILDRNLTLLNISLVKLGQKVKLQHSFFARFRLHCAILNITNSVETLSTNMKTILLCATNLTKLNKKNPRGRKIKQK